MATEPKRIAVDPTSDLARLLDEAAGSSLLLEKDGVIFRITTESPRRRADYDPRDTVAAMRAAAGSWKDIDAEAFKAQLYRARDEGTKPQNPV